MRVADRTRHDAVLVRVPLVPVSGVRERLAIGRELRRTFDVVCRRDRIQLPARDIDDVGITPFVANERRRRRIERECAPIGRPRRRTTHGVRAARDLGRLLGVEINHPHVIQAQIAFVYFGVVAPTCLRFGVSRERIGREVRNVFTIGRPRVADDAIARRRQRPCLSTISIQQPELRTWSVVTVRRAARADERDQRTVRRPLRLRLTTLAERELTRRTARERHDPDVRAAIVFVTQRAVTLGRCGVRVFPRRDRIQHAITGGREGDCTDAFDAHEIIGRDRALGLCRQQCRGEQHRGKQQRHSEDASTNGGAANGHRNSPKEGLGEYAARPVMGPVC